MKEQRLLDFIHWVLANFEDLSSSRQAGLQLIIVSPNEHLLYMYLRFPYTTTEKVLL